MLGIWKSHSEYLNFLSNAILEEKAQNSQIVKDYETTILKFLNLNLDVIKPDLEKLFSVRGRPSNQQPEIFRAFILMSDQKYASLENFCKAVKANHLFCALVGVEPNDFPGESTLRDFISRLWDDDELEHTKIIETPVPKPKDKHGKNKKPPKNPGIIKELADKALEGETFGNIPEQILQKIFAKVAVQPSIDAGLIENPENITVSGDGTCIESHANPQGHKTSEPNKRWFADPVARWLWDSYHECYFFGFMAYIFSTYNTKLKLDLPLYLRFAETSSFDGVTFIESLAHFRDLYKGTMTIGAILADSAHDNYATYNLLHQLKIKPFIDLNPRTSAEIKPQNIAFSINGKPICPDGYEMINWGYDAKRSRIKYRCPLIAGNVSYCPYDCNCNKSLYGKTVYVRLLEDLRLLTPVPRGSDEWKETYKQRSAAERVNNRILTDYDLERPKRYGKKKLAFFTFINAINIHLDSLAKYGAKNVESLLAA